VNIPRIITESADLKIAMLTSCLTDIENAVKIMINAYLNNKKILWCGNGGSAADAQHMAAELMGGLRDHSRPAIPSIALTTDSSFITAWANDTSYESIFSRQIEGIGRSGDVLIAISTSGNSINVINAINIAKKMDISVIVLTGESGGQMNKSEVDAIIKIPSNDTQRIQEGHLLVEHILCESVEAETLSK
jgi:D-sedoheptulose 7-phosphate isomerase